MKLLSWSAPVLALFLVLSCREQPATTVNAAPATPATNSQPTAEGYLPHAQPRLKTIKVWLGAEELKAELAVREVEVMTGMMWRTNMLEDEAMLFVFAAPRQQGFYMLNCTVPLSAAYIDADGVINEIVDLHPGVKAPVMSKSDQIKYVLEVPQGWFKRHGIRTGTVINTEVGPLKSLRGVTR